MCGYWSKWYNMGAYGIGCDANSVWVSVDGNDFTGDGSQNNPLRYIGTAVSNATTGAKIKILPGTYSENVTVSGKDLSFIGIGDKDQVILDGQGQSVGNAITASSSKFI